MEIRSTFCDRFVCLADRCRHSCCRGWEIEVDEETARRYRSMDGALGDELRAQLQREGDIWSLRLTEREDCPFLRTDGLCRLILELGEDARTGDTAECLRRWSAEMEYSTENVERLLAD